MPRHTISHGNTHCLPHLEKKTTVHVSRLDTFQRPTRLGKFSTFKSNRLQSQNVAPKPKPQPLELSQEKRENPYVVSAYNQCLKLEASLQQNLDNDLDVATKLVYVRIPGYLLHHVPSEGGLQKVVAEIISCGTDEALQLGIMYFTHYIRAFRANKCRTPIPSNDASPPSFDTRADADMVDDTLDDAPQSHTNAKKKALIRDGYRCVMSRKYDASSLDMVTELRNQYISERMDSRTYTECAHIFSS